MSDPFVHLHVASGYSLRHGASPPPTLVDRAAEHGMDTLALTDRDGVYGAVKFVTACMAAGIRPVLGTNLAVHAGDGTPSRKAAGSAAAFGPQATENAARRRSSPARGGPFVDARLPRVTVLARDKAGWASVCRLVSATHLAGERGEPVTTLDLVAEHARGLVVLLGPDSEVGRAVAGRRPDLARAHLQRWRAALVDGGAEPHDVVVEIVCHRGPGDVVHAARLLSFAHDLDLPVVLTNAVRGADRRDGPTLDVLDSARRLVALDPRHVDRVNAEAYLKSGKEMHLVADDVVRGAGLGGDAARNLLAATRRLAERCVLDPRRDLGVGEVHFPEFSVARDARNGWSEGDPAVALQQRCEAGLGRRGMALTGAVRRRLDDELSVIAELGYPTYFLTIADVVALVKDMGVRCAARGSGAGSLVNYLLGISDVDPIEHRLLMERFLSPLRHALPDIDLDVESARRTEVYEKILDRYGGERCACVSMMDTYRARHAIRDTGAALGLPPDEIDAVAKAFPHIRASQIKAALDDLPELRASRLGKSGAFDALFTLAERLDGLPRHVALHPCGVLLSDLTLLDRTPVEASWLGFPMSQFDKDDVEALGLLKLDVLGIRMQSAIAHALTEVKRVDGVDVDIDTIPRDDPETFALIQSTRTLGMFQIESPGQRELVGKFAPETFADIITDISLFRPGPVKSDMVRPFLEARQGWADPDYLHDDLHDALEQTCGVVVFHEQVIEMFSVLSGCSLAEADEARRALGDPDKQADIQAWFIPTALRRGYDLHTVERAWEILKAFASFGFCKAHAAAFALPTYQSAWLKAHHPAAFLAGVLTHDPGMYPKRLILDDARQFGISILPLDVNVSTSDYVIEKLATYDEPPPAILGEKPEPQQQPEWMTCGQRYGIRLALSDVKGINEQEIARIVAGRPYGSLSDFWHRASVSRPIVERLVLAGAFDSLYGIGCTLPVKRRGKVTRRDLLLQVADLDRWSRSMSRSRGRRTVSRATPQARVTSAEGRTAPSAEGVMRGGVSVRDQAKRQSQAAAEVRPVDVQLALDLGDAPDETTVSGLPELTAAEQVRAELEVLGLDASRHVLTAYEPFFRALQVTRARDLMQVRNRAEILVAGVKVATQTPPIRSGRRVVFITLDDATGPVDAALFEDAQAGYAATVFHSWLLVVRGTLRRTGPRGLSINATGAWEMSTLRNAWELGGLAAVDAEMRRPQTVTDAAVQGAAESRSTRPVMTTPPVGGRAAVYASGFAKSPYADIAPAGTSPSSAPRKLWHSSPGSSGG
ncbi:MAG TPA: DNA polymerase III subunit alpha [Mycobacteriales bacterium]|jgi:error-prone DNA polymerase|nr:DNA polymerase III subunit alpha [Mycobacteriales bacterium]